MADTKMLSLPLETHARLKRLSRTTGHTMANLVDLYATRCENVALSPMSEGEREKYLNGKVGFAEMAEIWRRASKAGVVAVNDVAANDNVGDFAVATIALDTMEPIE